LLKPEDIAVLKKFVIEEIESSWRKEGHYLTGKLVSDMGLLVNGIDPVTFEGHLYKYAQYMDQGVSPDRIKSRFAPARIAGLIRYVKLRMDIDDLKKARSIAYAIATKHKQRGMPLRAPTGTKWMDKALNKLNVRFEEKLFQIYGVNFELQMENLLKEYQTQLQ
jgi:hypothetical protein